MTVLFLNGQAVPLTPTLFYETVSRDGIQLFAGTIDKYFYTDRYIACHFRFIDHYDYEIEENLVIKYTDEPVVGKQLFFDVYVDKFIFVDTQTDKYSIFDDKESIEEYAGSPGISSNWEKVKYDD